MSSYARQSLRAVLVLSLWLAVPLLPQDARAQQYFDPGIVQTPIMSRPSDYAPRGVRLGSFMLNAGATLTWLYNDNVFYLEDDEIGDDAWLLRPRAELSSDWNRHALNVSTWAETAQYAERDANDYTDWSVRADGRLDVYEHSWFSADAHYMRLHEDRRSPDARASIEPTPFDYSGFGLGYDHIFNRLKVGAYFNRNTFDYENTLTGEGELLDNQDRNRDQDRLTFRADYQVGAETAIFGSYGVNSIDYALPFDSEGVNRNSDGMTAAVGVRFDFTGLLTGDLSVNYNEQDYDDPTLLDVDGWGVGAGLTWLPRPTTTVAIRFSGSPQETTQPGTSGYFSQLWSARWQQELRPNLLFSLRGSWTDNSYENPGFEETELSSTEVYRADVGLSYVFNRRLAVSGGYSWERQDANIDAFGYTSNRYFVTLHVDL